MPEPIDWLPDGAPFSPRFGDRYHSSANHGVDQARDAFLGGCGLPAAWAGHAQWRILETGFGLGLNFLVTWAAWRADPARPRVLHFVSCEAWPVAAAVPPHGVVQVADGMPLATLIGLRMAGQRFGQSRFRICHQNRAGGHPERAAHQLLVDLPPALAAGPGSQRNDLARRRQADQGLEVAARSAGALVASAVGEHRGGQRPQRVGRQVDLVGLRVEDPAVQGGRRQPGSRGLSQRPGRPPIGVRRRLFDGLPFQTKTAEYLTDI